MGLISTVKGYLFNDTKCLADVVNLRNNLDWGLKNSDVSLECLYFHNSAVVNQIIRRISDGGYDDKYLKILVREKDVLGDSYGGDKIVQVVKYYLEGANAAELYDAYGKSVIQ